MKSDNKEIKQELNENRKNIDEYKNSELGLLPENWTITPLKKLNSKKKTSLNPAKFENETFEYYSIPDYLNSKKPSFEKGKNILSQKIILKTGAVLFGKLNPRVEKVWMVKSASNCRKIGSTEWIPIFPNNNIDPTFLYFLEWSKFVMPIAKTLVSGSTPSRQRVSIKGFYEIKVPLPPLIEQQKIAEVLSTVQKAIEKTDVVIESIKSLKNSIMKYLFTYGHVPVNEAENVQLKDTEISSIPENWEIKTLEETTDVSYGIQASVAQNTDPSIGIPILTNVNITFDGLLNLSELKYYDINQKKNGERYLLKKGDVLFNWRSGSKRHVGKTAYFDLDAKMVCSSFILRIRSLDEQQLNSKYIYYYLSYLREILHYFENITDFLINAKFNASHAKQVPIQIPPVITQQQIVHSISAIDARLESEQHKKNALQKFYQVLLNDLMTARIRVTDLVI